MSYLSVTSKLVDNIYELSNNFNKYGEYFVGDFENCMLNVLDLFNISGMATLKPVSTDIKKNLKKLRECADKYTETDLSGMASIEYILKREKEDLNYTFTEDTDKKNQSLPPDNSGILAILWLRRTLEFACEFFIRMTEDNKSPKNAATETYNITLKQYHSGGLRCIFSSAFSFLPTRNAFLKKIKLEKNDVDKCFENLINFSKTGSACVDNLKSFYKKNQIEITSKV